MNKFLIFFLVSAFSTLVQVPNYNYIIVGAGYAGLGACRTLTAAGVPAAQILVIEAKNRIGGRCTNFTYGGVQQDLGACYIHNPSPSNALDNLAKLTPSFPKVRAYFGSEQEWYVNQTLVSSADFNAAQTLYSQFVGGALNAANNYNNDVDLASVLNNFWNTTPGVTQYSKDRVNMVLQLWAI